MALRLFGEEGCDIDSAGAASNDGYSAIAFSPSRMVDFRWGNSIHY